MDYIDDYKNRLRRVGNNVGEVYENNTIAFINSTFDASPTFRVMDVISYKYPDITKMDARVVEVERLGTLRELILRPTDSLEIGMYVKFDDDTWLLIDKYGGTGSTSIKMLAIKCNRVIKWIGRSDSTAIKEYQCVASATDLGSKSKQSKNDINHNKYDVRLPDGQLLISVELNPDTDTIQLNDRFIFGKKVYEIIGFDDVTLVDNSGYGIIQFTVKITTSQEKDDFINSIAFNNYNDSNTSTTDEGRVW